MHYPLDQEQLDLLTQLAQELTESLQALDSKGDSTEPLFDIGCNIVGLYQLGSKHNVVTPQHIELMKTRKQHPLIQDPERITALKEAAEFLALSLQDLEFAIEGYNDVDEDIDPDEDWVTPSLAQVDHALIQMELALPAKGVTNNRAALEPISHWLLHEMAENRKLADHFQRNAPKVLRQLGNDWNAFYGRCVAFADAYQYVKEAMRQQ
jgi:hypothetical protein